MRPKTDPASDSRRRRPVLLGVLIATTLVILVGSCRTLATEGSPEDRLTAYTAKLRSDFPDVEFVSIREALCLKSPLFLDARKPEEFAVSRIPGAVRADDNLIALLRDRGVSPDTEMIVYCSVGLRSAWLARNLRKAGFTRVRNLEGSIFGWANTGYPLENDRGPTEGVHPFNVWWGRYLKKSRWRWRA